MSNHAHCLCTSIRENVQINASTTISLFTAGMEYYTTLNSHYINTVKHISLQLRFEIFYLNLRQQKIINLNTFQLHIF